jgi:hypothetical protein
MQKIETLDDLSPFYGKWVKYQTNASREGNWNYMYTRNYKDENDFIYTLFRTKPEIHDNAKMGLGMRSIIPQNGSHAYFPILEEFFKDNWLSMTVCTGKDIKYLIDKLNENIIEIDYCTKEEALIHLNNHENNTKKPLINNFI